RFLLDESEPGVVWRAQVELLGRPHDSPAAVRAREQARRTGLAAGVLEGQEPPGYWGSPGGYGVRWGGTAWRVSALAQLGADPEDPRVERGAATLLESLQPRDGGFSPARGKIPSSCFTAEVCAALARFGFAHQPRVREAMAWLASRPVQDGGWSCPDLRHLVGGSCPIAAVAVLRLVGELPESERRRATQLSSRAASYLTEHDLFARGGAPRGWLAFSWPNLGRTDLIDALAALALAERPGDASVTASLPLVIAGQDETGRWRQHAGSPYGEPVGVPGRWVTLRALVAISRYGETVPAITAE
ncbi:MAG: prenyltransferase/squalene oxidase repeat-containing protein, partial [Acidobacteriota bacterium]